jgi:Cytochrome P460
LNIPVFHRTISAGRSWLLPTVACLVLVSLHAAANGPDAVQYPVGYRTWVHVKTVLVGAQSPAFQSSGGFHHIYANDKAMSGYEKGNFPDGAILIFDLLEAKEKDGVTAEGARQRIDVMVKDSKRFSTTGGWAFERFLGDSETVRPLTEEQRKDCFECHASQKERGFVFSSYRK